MVTTIGRACALALGVMAAAAPLAAQDMPPDITVNVVREYAAGTIFVNGVPVHSYAYEPTNAGTPVTDAVSVGLWLVDGENAIAVDSKATQDGGYAEVTIMESFDVPPYLEQRIDGQGRAEVTVTTKGTPPWAWLDAEPVTGDGSDLLVAVAALHDAIARKDMAAFESMHAAKDVDFTKVFGPMPEDMRAEMRNFLTTVPLQPLASDLVATAYLDGRLWVVTDGAGGAPVMIFDEADPVTRLATGQFWTKKDGAWQVVR
jgi:hypothetical protein